MGIVTRLPARREAVNLTQGQLAQALGVSRQTINSIERGRFEPSLPLALLTARYFGCSVEDLFQLE